MRLLFNCKAQSIVEISLITPLLLVTLYVPVDFGIAIFTGHITQNAVRDGARIASRTDLLDATKADTLATQVYNNLPQMLVSGSKLVTVNYFANGAAGCAQNVEVVAQGTYNYFLYRLIALLGFSPPNSIQISRTTRMRYEFQPDTNSGLCATATASGTHS